MDIETFVDEGGLRCVASLRSAGDRQHLEVAREDHSASRTARAAAPRLDVA